MLDVGFVAQLFLSEVLPSGGVANRLLVSLSLFRARGALAWIAFFVALRDLGKATPAFSFTGPPRPPASEFLAALTFPTSRELRKSRRSESRWRRPIEGLGITGAMHVNRASR